MAVAIFQKHNHIINFVKNFDKRNYNKSDKSNLFLQADNVINNKDFFECKCSGLVNTPDNPIHNHLNDTINHDNLKKQHGFFKPKYNRGQIYSLFTIFVLIEEVKELTKITFKQFISFYRIFNIDIDSRLSRKYFQEICDDTISRTKSSSFGAKEFNEYDLNEIRAILKSKITIANTKNNEENLKSINNHLTLETRCYFDNMFDIAQVQLKSNKDNKKYLVCGDIDGSLPRMILFGLQAKNIFFKTHLGWQCLSLLLELESMHSRNNDIIGFQKSKRVLKLLELIMEDIYFERSENTAIFIGDILHDRFSNNKDLTRVFIEKAYAVGMVFIKGNHDDRASLPEDNINLNNILYDSSNKRMMTELSQWGLFRRVDSYNFKQWKEFENKYFQIAYYDESIFCIHNGVQMVEENDNLTFKTFCGNFNLTEINSYVNDKNMLEKLRDALNKKTELNQEEIFSFTEFRPKDKAVFENTHVLDPFVLNNVTLIHGHDDDFGYSLYEKYPIVNVNARKNRQIKPVCVSLS